MREIAGRSLDDGFHPLVQPFLGVRIPLSWNFHDSGCVALRFARTLMSRLLITLMTGLLGASHAVCDARAAQMRDDPMRIAMVSQARSAEVNIAGPVRA